MSQDKSARLTELVADLNQRIGAGKAVVSGLLYDQSRDVLNSLVTSKPDLIVLCENPSDVRAAVSLSIAKGFSLSVRGGGSSSRSIQGEVVIDITRLNAVRIEGGTAILGGGATTMKLAEAVLPHGLTPVTGIVGSVGVAGLTLGGGYGHFTAKFGLASDNMLGAEVVLADGQVVQADTTHAPDLFWALRGGCGNFGVVTELRVRLHPIEDSFDGTIAFPWEQARHIFEAYGSFIKSVPDELTLKPLFFMSSDGSPQVVFHYTWCGDRKDDERMLALVKDFGQPSAVNVSRRTLAASLREADKRSVRGRCLITRTVTLPEFLPGAVDVIVRAMEHRSSPLSWIASHPFYGYGERIPVESTAFGIRSRHQMVGIYSIFPPGDEAKHREWADTTEAALKAFALHSAYPNYFGTDRPEQADMAFGPNTSRLLRVKDDYDPANIFDYKQLPSRRQAAPGEYLSHP